MTSHYLGQPNKGPGTAIYVTDYNLYILVCVSVLQDSNIIFICEDGDSILLLIRTLDNAIKYDKF